MVERHVDILEISPGGAFFLEIIPKSLERTKCFNGTRGIIFTVDGGSLHGGGIPDICMYIQVKRSLLFYLSG